MQLGRRTVPPSRYSPSLTPDHPRSAASDSAFPHPLGDRHQPSALVISGSVGAGHDGAAEELASRLRARGLSVDVRDYLDALPRPCRFFLRQGYATSVQRFPFVFEWLFHAVERPGRTQAAMRAFCRLGDRGVSRWTRERPYAVVVSTYPLASQSLGGLRERRRLDTPVVTYLTDPAANGSWIHAAVDHHLTVTTQAAEQGTADYGIVMQAAGPLVPARFRTVDPARCRALRCSLGLSPRSRVALLVTGSLGLGDLADTAHLVADAGLVPVVLCGRNDALRRRMSAIPGVVALGWRDDVHVLMHAADVLVHNAGGLSFTEAYVAGLPAVSYRCIAGHGLANAASLDKAGLARWAHAPEEFILALREESEKGKRLTTHADPALHILDLLGLVLPTASPPRSTHQTRALSATVRLPVDLGREHPGLVSIPRRRRYRRMRRPEPTHPR